jgi:hypothetical protein
MVIHPLQREVAGPSLLGDLVQILVLAEGFEDGSDHGIGLSSADDLTGAAHDAHTLEDSAGEGTGDHGTLSGGGTNIDPAVILSPNKIVSQGCVLIEVQKDEVTQRSSMTERSGERQRSGERERHTHRETEREIRRQRETEVRRVT